MLRNLISYFIFSILIFITAFQFSAWGITGEIYNFLRIAIFITILILFSLNFKNTFNYYQKIPLLRVHFWCLLFFFSIITVLFAFGFNIDFSPIRDLALALVILLIGINIDLTKKQYTRIVNLYIFLYTIASLSIVYTYSSGFIIHEQYLPLPKNQIAPAFGVAFLLSFYMGFKQKRIFKIIYYLFAALLVASLLVIRGRAVLVATFITVFIFIFYYIKSRKYRFLIITFILLLIPLIGNFIYESLFLNYDISDINSISTGRMERNISGLEFFLQHPFFGIFENQIYTGQIIHNYFLINLVSYGLIFSSLILAIYFKYIFTIIKAIKLNTFQYFEVGPLVMAIVLVVSIFEYTYPYAPGSTIFFPFFLLGQYLKKMSMKWEELKDN